jgi:hypothetical protein
MNILSPVYPFSMVLYVLRCDFLYQFLQYGIHSEDLKTESENKILSCKISGFHSNEDSNCSDVVGYHWYPTSLYSVTMQKTTYLIPS